MPKLSLGGFKDPVRRPRWIIWTGVVALVGITFTILALGVTSSYWFCADVCHKVQDDTIIAYDMSSHSEISCMACHMPANADPVTFMLHKVEALGELYLTVTDKYELPLNPGSHLSQDADHMGSGQCTQCHNLDTREVTPSEGILIDHDIHSENEVHCTLCHNRVAHPEDFELTLPGNEYHPNFMEMTACFRCHGQGDDAEAPGECSKCHPPDFPLKPESHFEADFYPAGHAELAQEDKESVEAAGGTWGSGSSHAEEGTETAEHEGEAAEGEEAAHEDEEGEEGDHEGEVHLASLDQVSYCFSCHSEEFCENCHGMAIPHPQDFLEETHGEVAAAKPDKCDMCHQPAETGFCDSCHHGTEIEWEYDVDEEWATQHATSARENGVEQCTEQCHNPQFCADCHAATNPYPTSHTSEIWRLNPPEEEAAEHADGARSSMESCEVCHGEGGTEAAFCTNCHQLEIPHPEEFTEFHAQTGRENEAVCRNCHVFPELCSNCHHAGSSTTEPWQSVHPRTVSEQGAEGCLEKCHDKAFCVNCHTTTNVVPTSHTVPDWTRRQALTTPAKHPEAYEQNTDSCTYCHGEGGPTDNEFCVNCHQLEMPHPGEFKDSHGPDIAEGALSQAVCANCHSVVFCNNCHHEGATGSLPWQQEHPAIVKENGAEPCFECHDPTYCAQCHVSLGR